MLLLILVAQVATLSPAPPAGPVATRSAPATAAWSILEPIPNEPCTRRAQDSARSGDVVVCGRPLPSQALPYPQEIVPAGPQPSNPDLSGRGAMAVADSTPCAAMQRGCTTGVDLFGGATQLVRAVQNVVAPGSCCEDPGESRDIVKLGRDMAHGIGAAFRKKPDKSGRVPIALDDEARPSVVLP